MNAWHAFKWTLRSVFFDKGPVVPAVAGILLYFVFYPLPYKPETVHAVPVVVVDYDSSPMSRQLERDLDATEAVKVWSAAWTLPCRG
jgi:ABC-2 type transport system permease protein